MSWGDKLCFICGTALYNLLVHHDKITMLKQFSFCNPNVIELTSAQSGNPSVHFSNRGYADLVEDNPHVSIVSSSF